ncbi:MAG: AraC family transcriptional regulator [Oligoflexia bacterium]|nr:AraC family transcriptional regulator [Oligoflexia bacterium]
MNDTKILEHHVENLGRCLDFIEAHITRRMSVQDLAKQARMSLWHFQRVFHAIIGEPAKTYLRRRKLTHASRMLLQSNASLEALAVGAGFRSPEAFTRAFTSQFGMPPGTFRKLGKSPELPAARARIDRTYVEIMFSKLSRPKVTIQELPAIRLYGISGKFYSCFSDRTDSTVAIPKLWIDLHQHLGDQGRALAKGYRGLITAPNDARSEQFTYHACVEPLDSSSPIPAGLIMKDSSPGLYATFEQTNPGANVVHSLNYVFCIWLEQSEYEFDTREEFELYSPEYSPNDSTGCFHYGIPVRPKAPR